MRCGAENPRFVRRRVRRNVSNPSAVPCDLTGEAGAARADDRADDSASAARAEVCRERARTRGNVWRRGCARTSHENDARRVGPSPNAGTKLFWFSNGSFWPFLGLGLGKKQKIQPPPRAAAPR